jgi:hypothetical protein
MGGKGRPKSELCKLHMMHISKNGDYRTINFESMVSLISPNQLFWNLVFNISANSTLYESNNSDIVQWTKGKYLMKILLKRD